MSLPNDIIIGIDLGTTNSLAAYSDAAGPLVLKNVGDDSLTDASGLVPSVVHFEPAGGIQVGAAARAQAVAHPLSTIYSIKRLMGLGWQEAQNERKHLAYQVVSAGSGVDDGVPVAKNELAEAKPAGHEPRTTDSTSDIVLVDVAGRHYSPQEISALILRAVKRRADLYFKRDVRKAVITVPAYFNDSQRQATKDAGRIAGLEVVRIVNEPTAAALAYGLGERVSSDKPRLLAGALFAGCPSNKSADQGTAAPATPGKLSLPILPLSPHPAAPSGQLASPTGPNAPRSSLVAVYDLGGGTFDISILQLEEGVFQVLSTHGDTHLGGDDMDRELISLFHREIEQQLGHKLEFPPSTRQALRDFAEAAKIRLSTADSATVEIEVGNMENAETPKLESSQKSGVRSQESAIGNVPTQNSEFRIQNSSSPTPQRPLIYRRTVTREEFERLIYPWVERTIEACQIALKDARHLPSDIGEVVLVGGCTRIPLVKRRVAEFFGRVPYDAINPDEVVALGAAVQASILAGVRRDVLLLDVVPLSLGIETMGGAMGKLIMKNTPIPAMAKELFSTYVDGQTRVAINVLQGERELAKDCRSLGRFELSGLPPMPAGLPKIEVTFLIDANGILSVSATEQRSGVQASIQVVPAHGLTKEEVDRLEAEAIAKAREDFAAHRLIDLRLNVTRDLTAARRDLSHAGREIEPVEKQTVEDLMARLQTLQDSTDPDAIHQALEEFNHHPARIRLAEKAITAALRG